MTYCYGLASVVVRRALTSSSQELLGQSSPNLVCSICRVRRQEIVNFMTPHPKGRNCGGKKCKIDVFLKKSSSLLPGIDQTNQVCSNDDQGRVYQNCKFHDPRGRGSCARVWPYKSWSKNALFLKKSSSLLPGIDQTNQVGSNDDQGRV